METDDLYYEISETAIKDHSMLGAHGQKLCTNMDVYWMTQTCSPDEDETRKYGVLWVLHFRHNKTTRVIKLLLISRISRSLKVTW